MGLRTTSRRAEGHRVRDIAELAAEWPSIEDGSGRRLRWDPPPMGAETTAEAPLRRPSIQWDQPLQAEEPVRAEPAKTGRGRHGVRRIGVLLLLLAVVILAGTLAIAQQTTKPGKELSAKPADAEAIIDRTVIGDWVYGCLNQPRPAPKQCFIRQQLAEGKTKAPVFTWTIGQGPHGDVIAVWQTPTGVMVGPGVLFDIGGDKPVPVPYHACTRGQCQAAANLAPEFLDRLGKAEKASATIVSAAGKGLAFNFSVKGLADGLAALKKK